MKLFKLYFFVCLSICACITAASQNVVLNILTQNAGIITKGKTLFVELSLCNTDPTDYVPAYKLKPQVSVPSGIVSISTTGHNLPSGWTIINNNGSTINISNGTDMIPPNTCRTVMILLNANALGGPSTISGQLLFSNGTSPGSAPGTPTLHDSPADNTSTTACRIVSGNYSN